MADSSLDDFFAKKDKSKKKGKAKFTSNDLLEKQIQKQKSASLKKKEDEQQVDVDPRKEDDEWLDVQEEEKDYSGLRIQNLQVTQEKDEEDKQSDAKGSEDEDEDSSTKGESSSGPWAKVQTPAPVSRPEKVPEPEPEPKRDDTPSRPAKYVPPAARQAAAQQPMGMGMGPANYRRGKKTAPDLRSEEDFPTLGMESQAASDSIWGSGAGFEKVKSGSGSRPSNNPANKGPELSLSNKFSAFQGGTA